VGASSLSLLALLVLLLVSAISHTEGLAWTPLRRPAVPFSTDFGKLFGWTLTFLVAQESLERTATADHLLLANSTLSGWLSLSAAAALAAFALAAARQLGRAAARRLLQRPPRPIAHADAPQGWRVVLAPGLRARPLAERFGLRAPPVSFT
jgi:hypothetical protein